MTLFDGKPLEEQEITVRVLCECEHTYAEHDPALKFGCSKCPCDRFTASEP